MPSVQESLLLCKVKERKEEEEKSLSGDNIEILHGKRVKKGNLKFFSQKKITNWSVSCCCINK